MEVTPALAVGEFLLKVASAIAAALFAISRYVRSLRAEWDEKYLNMQKEHAALRAEVGIVKTSLNEKATTEALSQLSSEVAKKDDLDALESMMHENTRNTHAKIDDSNRWLLSEIMKIIREAR